MVDGQAAPCMASVHGWCMGVWGFGVSDFGGGLLWGVLEVTTYNRQPARQKGVEVLFGVGGDWGGGACCVHAPVSCPGGCACTGDGDGERGTGNGVYDPGARALVVGFFVTPRLA